MLKAIIFDMDGVLIDSEPVHKQANAMLMEALGLPFDEQYYAQFVGSTTTYMWDKMIRDFSITHTPDELMAMSDGYVKEINGAAGYPEIPAVGDLIRGLVKMKAQKDLKLAVASSSQMSRITYVLECMGLSDAFDGIVSGIQVAHPKPAPDTFLKAAELLGVSPQECLVIEDSWNGMKAAKAAGMVCVGFENPLIPMEEQNMEYADYVIQGFADIDFRFLDMIYCHQMDEPWVALETERLYCREMTLKDLDRLYEMYAEPSISRFMENLYEDRKEEEEFSCSYIENMYKFYGYGNWMVCLKENDKIIGRAGLTNREIDGENSVEVGYMIDVAYQKQGYATEIICGILEFAKQYLCLERIRAVIQKDNQISIALIEKLGFLHEFEYEDYVVYYKVLTRKEANYEDDNE